MALDTDFNIDPYFDDYDETKNFHRILFRPSVVVQARELTQLQTILQNQIERFGENIFVNGTVIQGCNFNYDPNYFYVKLQDLRADGQPTVPEQYVGLEVRDVDTGLRAIVINSVPGFESQNPDLKTIYIKYLNSGSNNVQQFEASKQLKFYANSSALDSEYINGYDALVAPLQINGVNTNPVGKGYAFSVTEGVIFQKCHFVRVANNLTAIISKYTNTPNNVSVGFSTEENIINELGDNSLYDNASGYTNTNAPGAHRLQLIPTLVTSNTNIVNTSTGAVISSALPSNNFFSLVQWENGNIVRVNQNTEYNKIGSELARRSYDTNGDYVVRKFTLGSEKNLANNQYFNTIIGAGLGYVNGYRIEQLNATRVVTRKGTDVQVANNQTISTNYGNYIVVSEVAGSFSPGDSVNLYDAAGLAVSNGGYSSISGISLGNVIGTATVLSMTYASGTVNTPSARYNVYLTDVKMTAGKAFYNVKSVRNSINTAVADIVLEFNPSLSANVATIKDSSFSKAVFSTGKSDVKTLNLGDTPTFIYRENRGNVVIGTDGITAAITLNLGTEFPYGLGVLNSIQEQSVIIVPEETLQVNATSGTVSVSNSNTIVTGASTTFLSQYQIDDYIIVGGSNIRRIVGIANNTQLSVNSAFPSTVSGQTHRKCYPKNVPINFSDRNSYVEITNNSRTLTSYLRSASNTQETLVAGNEVSIYYDIKYTKPNLTKVSNQNRFVCIDTADRVVLTGTVTANTTSATVTGSGTTFQKYIAPGYKLYIANNSSNAALLGTVSTIASNTSLTLSANSLVNITANTIAYSSNNTYGINGPWPLGLPDVYRLRSVYKIPNGQEALANSFSISSAVDVTSEFAISSNQTDTVYNISSLVKRPGSTYQLTNGDKLVVSFDVFTISGGTQTGFFSVDSYPIDDANTANTSAIQTKHIPVYVSTSGERINLRDAIDFRNYVNATVSLASTANLSVASTSAVNPVGTNSFTATSFISPNQNFTYDVSYYLGRVDKIVLNASGAFSMVEGIPSETPKPPQDQLAAMTIGTITIPPYPSLLPTETDNLTKSFPTVYYTETQNKRYTMKDIDDINTRVSSVEYYSSLSLLETQTKDLVIKSTDTGLDRFKNGIFVDNFETTLGMNLGDKEHNIGRDPTESSIVPRSQQFMVELKYDTEGNYSSNTISKTGDLVTLNYEEVILLSQNRSTRVRNCTEGYYNWNGIMGTAPTYDSFIDVRVEPVTQVINNITNIQETTINNTTITNISETTINNVTNTTNNGQPIVSPAPTPTVVNPPAIVIPPTVPDPIPVIVPDVWSVVEPIITPTGGRNPGRLNIPMQMRTL